MISEMVNYTALGISSSDSRGLTGSFIINLVSGCCGGWFHRLKKIGKPAYSKLSIRRQRLVSETQEDREARLQQLSIRRQRLVSETQEDREACLQQLSMMRQRLVSGTQSEDRESRLQQVTIRQQRVV